MVVLEENLPVQADLFALNVILMLVGWLVGLGVVVVVVVGFALLSVVMKLFGLDVGNGVGGVVDLVCMLINMGLVLVFSAVVLRRVDASCVDTAELYSYPRPAPMG